MSITTFAPGPILFRHFIEEAEGQAGSIYGRKIYEIMRYWDEDHANREPEGAAFAAAWRKQTKWVVSGTDLPLNLHPAATGARLVFTPIGAG